MIKSGYGFDEETLICVITPSKTPLTYKARLKQYCEERRGERGGENKSIWYWRVQEVHNNWQITHQYLGFMGFMDTTLNLLLSVLYFQDHDLSPLHNLTNS